MSKERSMKIVSRQAWALAIRSSDTRATLSNALAGSKRDLLEMYPIRSQHSFPVKVTLVAGWKK